MAPHSAGVSGDPQRRRVVHLDIESIRPCMAFPLLPGIRSGFTFHNDCLTCFAQSGSLVYNLASQVDVLFCRISVSPAQPSERFLRRDTLYVEWKPSNLVGHGLTEASNS